MHVLRQDRAGITGIAALSNDLRKRSAYQNNVVAAEGQQWMLEFVTGLFIKALDLRRNRLDRLSSVMQVSQVRDFFHANLVRVAAARIVRQPPAVGGPDEVIAGYHVQPPIARARNDKQRTVC